MSRSATLTGGEIIGMTTDRLYVESRTLGDVPLILPHGEIDVYTVPEFEQAISDAVEQGGRVIIVDLSDISYLDSAGLSTMMISYQALSAEGGELYVVVPIERPAVRRVLEITRVDTLVKVRASLAEVRKELKLAQAA